MAINLGLLLQSAQAALQNNQLQHGLFLLEYAIKLSDEYASGTPSSLEVALALDQGKVRTTNEDCLVAFSGTLPSTQEEWGLFIICDGMGGHVYGQDAAYLACETILEHVLPFMANGLAPHEQWGNILIDGIHLANQALYRRNQRGADGGDAPFRGMGTTVTATLLIGDRAYIANVGDSRTYLFRQEEGLSQVTQDHSVVAQLLANRLIGLEEVYTHTKRNQIYRCLGRHPSVEVDSFERELQADDILLLCSDGLWEMTRDPKIASILAFDWALAPYMANRLLSLAKEGGAADNISLIVIQRSGRDRHNDIGNLSTVFSPIQGLARLVPAVSSSVS